MGGIRKIFLIVMSGLLITIILAYCCFIFLTLKRIDNNYDKYIKVFNNNLNHIINDELSDVKLDELSQVLDIVSKQYNASIMVKDASNKIIYDNSFNKLLKFYEVTNFLEVDNQTYLISYYENIKILDFNLIIKITLIDLGVVCLISIILITLSNQKFIVPILNLKRDIESYKYSVRPKKRQLKTEMDELHNSYVELIDNLEEEKQKQNRLIASISHDIKTPLTAIMGYSDRLKNANLNEETRTKYVNKIHTKSLVMKDIVEEFDDYLSCNIRNTLKREKVRIKDFLEDIRLAFKEELEEKNICLNIFTNCKDDTLIFDVLKIKRVFSNIITNSIRHFNNDMKKIDISCIKQDGYYEFCISDNGSGVDDCNLVRIFEPLFTTDQSRKIPGLGLSICKEIIESHDGEIFAKNNENGGLSIYFILF